MRAAVRGVIHTDDDLPRQQVLNSQVPLINLRIASGTGVQVTRVAEAPLRQFPVLSSLRRRQTGYPRCRGWKRVSERGELGLEIIFGEIHLGRFCKCRPGVLKIGSHVHSVEHSRAAAKYSTGGQLISKP